MFAVRTPQAAAGSSPAVEEALVDLERMPVGPELVEALLELPPASAAGWNAPRAQVRVAARWAAVANWAEGQSLAAIGAGSAAVQADDDHVAAINYVTDLALETQTGEGWADRQIDLANQLRDRLPAIGGLLRCAMLTVGHARALSRVLETADDATARRIDRQVTPRAVEHRWTPAELAAAARRMLLRVDPDGGASRHEKALDREANVTGGPTADGLAWISATGDAVTIGDILHAVDERAQQLQQIAPGTPVGRTRFAALGDLVLGRGFTLFEHTLGVDVPAEAGTPDAELGTAAPTEVESSRGSRRRQRRREVIVTIDLPTLLSLRNEPAQLAGYGPIPARLARLVAADATLRRMVTDPIDGEPLDLGRRAYAPTDNLVTAIRARDQHCQFPGCRRARQMALDHRTDWAQQGETKPANLQLLCARHHALKTAGQWSPAVQPDGSVVWTGPAGQTAIRRPEHDPPELADTG